MWDFSKGRSNKIMDMAVPEVDMVDNKVGKMCVVARGDGNVSILNVDSAPLESKSVKPKLGTKSQSTSKDAEASGSQDQDRIDIGLHLDYSIGGNTAAVFSVTFSTLGEKGKFIISGGNDKSYKIEDDLANHGNQLLRLNINLKKKAGERNLLCGYLTAKDLLFPVSVALF